MKPTHKNISEVELRDLTSRIFAVEQKLPEGDLIRTTLFMARARIGDAIAYNRENKDIIQGAVLIDRVNETRHRAEQIVLAALEDLDIKKPSDYAQSFRRDLGIDSLDFVELVMYVEEDVNHDFPDAEAEQWHTVEQMIVAIDKVLKTKPSEHVGRLTKK